MYSSCSPWGALVDGVNTGSAAGPPRPARPEARPRHRAGRPVGLQPEPGQVPAGDALHRQHLQPPAADGPALPLRRHVLADHVVGHQVGELRNHHSDSWVRIAPLSGIGVGSTTSYTETRSDATRIRSSPSAYTSRTLPRYSSSTQQVLAHPNAAAPSQATWVRSQPCGSVGRLIRTSKCRLSANIRLSSRPSMIWIRPLCRANSRLSRPTHEVVTRIPLDRPAGDHRPSERPDRLGRHDAAVAHGLDDGHPAEHRILVDGDGVDPVVPRRLGLPRAEPACFEELPNQIGELGSGSVSRSSRLVTSMRRSASANDPVALGVVGPPVAGSGQGRTDAVRSRRCCGAGTAQRRARAYRG